MNLYIIRDECSEEQEAVECNEKDLQKEVERVAAEIADSNGYAVSDLSLLVYEAKYRVELKMDVKTKLELL